MPPASRSRSFRSRPAQTGWDSFPCHARVKHLWESFSPPFGWSHGAPAQTVLCGVYWRDMRDTSGSNHTSCSIGVPKASAILFLAREREGNRGLVRLTCFPLPRCQDAAASLTSTRSGKNSAPLRSSTIPGTGRLRHIATVIPWKPSHAKGLWIAIWHRACERSREDKQALASRDRIRGLW